MLSAASGLWVLTRSSGALAAARPAAGSSPIEVPDVNVQGTYDVSELGCDGGPIPGGDTTLVIDDYAGGSFSGHVETPAGGQFNVSGVEAPEMANSENGPYYPPHITMTDPTGETGGDLNGWIQEWDPYTPTVTSKTHATEIFLVKPPFGCESDEGFLGDIHLDLVPTSCSATAGDVATPVAFAAGAAHCTTTVLRCLESNVETQQYLCSVVVTDVEPRKPIPPTGRGDVMVDWLSLGSRIGRIARSKSISCSLAARAPKWGVWFFVPPVTPAPSVSNVLIGARYPGDPKHLPSAASGINLALATTVVDHISTAREREVMKNTADEEALWVDACSLLLLQVDKGKLKVPIPANPLKLGLSEVLAVLAAGCAGAKVGVDIVKIEADHIDPIDLSYTTVARPKIPVPPKLPGGLSGSVSKPLRAWLTATLKAGAVLQALGTSENRAGTAGLLGDAAALGLQQQAIATYFDELAELTASETNDERQVGVTLRAANLDPVTVTVPADDSELVRAMERSTPPSYWLRLLIAAGESQAEAIADWRSLARSIMPGNENVSFDAFFTSPQWLAAEQTVESIDRADASPNSEPTRRPSRSPSALDRHRHARS